MWNRRGHHNILRQERSTKTLTLIFFILYSTYLLTTIIYKVLPLYNKDMLHKLFKLQYVVKQMREFIIDHHPHIFRKPQRHKSKSKARGWIKKNIGEKREKCYRILFCNKIYLKKWKCCPWHDKNTNMVSIKLILWLCNITYSANPKLMKKVIKWWLWQ